MKELTLKDKVSLVSFLESHYTIKEKNFINAIASNDEEKLNLTLKAYAIGAELVNAPTNVQTNRSVVVIDILHSKLQFVKAIKEAKGLPLKEAKDLADQLLITKEESFRESYSSPFIIGDSMDSKFSEGQWEKICRSMVNDMVWRYV